MKIIHIINSLKKGGAEGNLYRLSKFQKKKYKKKINIIIITLIDNGFYEKDMKKLGIKIFSLRMQRNEKIFDFVKKIIKLRNFIKIHNPDIIQSWMYHSNFITLFLPKKFYEKIFWSIRHSVLNFQNSKKKTIILSKICGLFSKIVPKKIIYNSEKSIIFNENNHFYSKNKTVLIENGYNDKTFYPSKYLRKNFRKKYKIRDSDIILGFAGRYSKIKNIPSLLIAFSKIVKDYDNVYLCMVGKDINLNNNGLKSLIFDLKIQDKVVLLNEKKNLNQFYNGIDLLVLTSFAESFPNVIAESMLCSTPVLSTDVGCSKRIIKDCGFIVKKNNQLSIMFSIKKSLTLLKNRKKWQSLKKNSRIRIKKNFSIPKMANSYLDNWVF